MTRATEDMEPLYLGRFVKAQGIHGELKLYASEDFWFEVLESKELFVERSTEDDVERYPVHVETARPHGAQYVLKIQGIETRSDAQREVGAELFVDIARLDVELPERELPFQVIGMTVRTEEGREIGVLTGVMDSPGQRVYEVTDAAGGVVLIPAVDAFVIKRDEENGEMTIRPIPGLIDGL
ncbi:MAG TPA: ribosome maturation factor RimM [Candidatus Krumholzibacteria bacterium]|nr:ribosome maturation factor RimM [Candidatus Krumholzibacteria bacterium]